MILNTERTVRLEDVSKRQLATTVNEQSEMILKLRDECKRMAKLLMTIASEPESLDFTDGRVKVNKLALDKTTFGSQLRIEYTDDWVILRTVSASDAPAAVAPRLVGLN